MSPPFEPLLRRSMEVPLPNTQRLVFSGWVAAWFDPIVRAARCPLPSGRILASTEPALFCHSCKEEVWLATPRTMAPTWLVAPVVTERLEPKLEPPANTEAAYS